MLKLQDIKDASAACLVRAGTRFRPDQITAYEKALDQETDSRARWVLEGILKNARAAQANRVPLCDDTGIPHVLVDIGDQAQLPQGWLTAVKEGIAQGLRDMPGRPMAAKGDARQRIEQSAGLHRDPAKMLPSPITVAENAGDALKVTVLLQGGGPEIRAHTHRVFHKRSSERVLDQVIAWAEAEAGQLGCTPSVLAVGVGRSHFEASAMMLQAMKEGDFGKQTDWEKKITESVNASGPGPLGLGGRTTVLGTFLKVGPTRASGVRIVSLRPCCCFEPRRAQVMIDLGGWKSL